MFSRHLFEREREREIRTRIISRVSELDSVEKKCKVTRKVADNPKKVSDIMSKERWIEDQCIFDNGSLRNG